jgi:hypothetical protein
MGLSMRLLVEHLHCPNCVAARNALDAHIASHRRRCYRDDEVPRPARRARLYLGMFSHWNGSSPRNLHRLKLKGNIADNGMTEPRNKKHTPPKYRIMLPIGQCTPHTQVGSDGNRNKATTVYKALIDAATRYICCRLASIPSAVCPRPKIIICSTVPCTCWIHVG